MPRFRLTLEGDLGPPNHLLRRRVQPLTAGQVALLEHLTVSTCRSGPVSRRLYFRPRYRVVTILCDAICSVTVLRLLEQSSLLGRYQQRPEVGEGAGLRGTH